MSNTYQPGPVLLFGSGETSASGHKVFHRLFSSLERPIQAAILETPAGFEPNSAWVAEQVASFLAKRLQNFAPETCIVPARKRNTQFCPDDPAIIAPLWSSNVLYLGAGSPTYAVRQLENSLAWHALTARQRLGAAVVLASASTLAAGAYTMPVYEIYKVGEDIHWKTGLDFFGAYGLALAFVPHWNNSDGGANLDTSRCYVGQARFDQLLDILPSGVTVVGIKEHSSLMVDINARTCHALGRGGVILLRDGREQYFDSGQSFAITKLGPFCLPELSSGIPAAILAQARAKATSAPQPPAQVLALVDEREAARTRREWNRADMIRDQISQLGWRVCDTLNGPKIVSPLGVDAQKGSPDPVRNAGSGDPA